LQYIRTDPGLLISRPPSVALITVYGILVLSPRGVCCGRAVRSRDKTGPHRRAPLRGSDI